MVVILVLDRQNEENMNTNPKPTKAGQTVGVHTGAVTAGLTGSETTISKRRRAAAKRCERILSRMRWCEGYCCSRTCCNLSAVRKMGCVNMKSSSRVSKQRHRQTESLVLQTAPEHDLQLSNEAGTNKGPSLIKSR